MPLGEGGNAAADEHASECRDKIGKPGLHAGQACHHRNIQRGGQRGRDIGDRLADGFRQAEGAVLELRRLWNVYGMNICRGYHISKLSRLVAVF